MPRPLLSAVSAVIALLGSVAPVGAQSGGDTLPTSYVEQVIDAADDSLGKHATITVLRAYDRGYDLLQIFEGLVDRSLELDGTVTDGDGAVVVPSRAPSGLIGGNAGSQAGGPIGGRARRGPTSPEAIGLDALERSIRTTTKRLDKQNHIGKRAADHDASIDVMMMLAVIALMNEGYSPEQIILDGFVEHRIKMDLGGVSIRDEKGKELRPDGVEPSTDEEPETVAQVDTIVDGLFDALSGEDPLSAADDSFKRQFTITFDVDVTTSDGITAAIEGKANVGERKGDVGFLSGRGTGTFTAKGACSLSDLNTTKYPYSLRAPVRVGVAGRETKGEASLNIGVVATSKVNVSAKGDSICLGVVRDTADVSLQLISIPELSVRLRDGATANADNQDSGQPFTVGVAVRVKEI